MCGVDLVLLVVGLLPPAGLLVDCWWRWALVLVSGVLLHVLLGLSWCHVVLWGRVGCFFGVVHSFHTHTCSQISGRHEWWSCGRGHGRGPGDMGRGLGLVQVHGVGHGVLSVVRRGPRGAGHSERERGVKSQHQHPQNIYKNGGGHFVVC